MGLFGKKYKTDASGKKFPIANDKEYLKNTREYIYNRTGNKSKATTLKEAREEAAAAEKMPITEGWKSYDQDTRVEVPTKRSFKEKRNIFGGKAGKAKNKKPKADTKLVRVKNEKQAAKAHKKRAEAGLTKERKKTTTKSKAAFATGATGGVMAALGGAVGSSLAAATGGGGAGDKTAGKKPEVETEEARKQSTSRRRVPLTAAAKKKKKEKQRAAEEKKRLKDILKAEKQKSLKKKAAALDDQWSL